MNNPQLPSQTQLGPATGAPLAQPKIVQNLGIKAFSPTDNIKTSTPVLPVQHQSAVQQNNPAAGQNTGAPANPPVKTDPNIAANGAANNVQSDPYHTSPSGILNTLVGTSQGQAPLSPVVQQAMDKYNALAAQSAAIGSQGAAAEAGQRSTGTTPVAEGNAAVTAQTVAAQQGALGQQEQAALAAGNLGVTGQATQQTGLLGALGAAQQTTNIPYDQQGVYTATGQNIGGGAGGGVALQSAVQQALQQIKNGAGYTNAINGSGLGHFGPAGITALQQALPQGFNINQSDAGAAAQASNIGTTGTAQTSAANTAYNNAVQNVSKVTGDYTAASGVGQNLVDTLGKWQQGGLITNVNEGLNRVAGLTSSPEYSQFLAAITNAQSLYGSAFKNAGIIPTQNTQNALNELNPNSSASAIIASLNQLSSDLHAATIVPAYQQQQTYAQQLGIQ